MTGFVFVTPFRPSLAHRAPDKIIAGSQINFYLNPRCEVSWFLVVEGIERDEGEDRMGKDAEKEKQDAATATAAKKKEEPPKPVDPFTQGMTGEEGIPRPSLPLPGSSWQRAYPSSRPPRIPNRRARAPTAGGAMVW
jgi:hypothetical protein